MEMQGSGRTAGGLEGQDGAGRAWRGVGSGRNMPHAPHAPRVRCSRRPKIARGRRVAPLLVLVSSQKVEISSRRSFWYGRCRKNRSPESSPENFAGGEWFLATIRLTGKYWEMGKVTGKKHGDRKETRSPEGFPELMTRKNRKELAVDKLPEFQCYKFNHPEAGPHHTATFTLVLTGMTSLVLTLKYCTAHASTVRRECMEEIGLACQDAWNGLSSRRPVIEMTIPSSLDKTISPPGKHVVSLFTQYTPYNLTDGSWEDPAYRESYAKRCFNLIDEYAPGFSSSVIGYDMLAPPDLGEGDWSDRNLAGGNIFHGAMSLDSLFLMRPVKGWSGYRTPVRGLYLCGSGTHPGGGVMGAPGRNSAQVVIQDLKKYYV
ncbi:Pyridine nucleotide-disulfide oxidoreductase domain-containing protein 2 [Vitis vinifera]|uniref:Pyridine nucleotide-disulfide oxidoreductase domain-containing protein 2 n=1 Tax=Vitis vinifera TaxID=29760 RepID=A0A438EW00_VITVI|nr:Pyridine nucleotide-disulfide oxidoreductase domain-containing protein 2 [Vitis vinifera]